MTFTSGPLVTQDWSSDRAANLGIAPGPQVSLNLPDSSCISPYDSVHAVGNQTSNYHEDDKEGKDHTAHGQAIAKSLVQDTIYQTVILVLGVNSCVEVELKASQGTQKLLCSKVQF